MAKVIKQTNETSFEAGKQRLRPLNIDFDQHTEGDIAFKRELITLLVKNVREFVQALADSISKNDHQIFAEACHKSKITLYMLDDDEYNSIVHTLQAHLAGKLYDAPETKSHATRFADLSDDIVASLNGEFTRSATL